MPQTLNPPISRNRTERARRSYLEKSVLENESSVVGFDDDTIVMTSVSLVPRIDLYKVAREKIKRPNGNIEAEVYSFMKDYIFGDDQHDCFERGGLENASKYFETLSKGINGDAKKALETARTVLLHLRDYISVEKGKRKGSFKKYLFGENGVLTQRRLRDMKEVSGHIKKFGLKAGENYRLQKGADKGFNIFNLRYSLYEDPNQGNLNLININDNDSKGMYTDYGRLYWNSFDRMFDKKVERGKVNTKGAVTRYVKKHLQTQVKTGNAVEVKPKASDKGYTYFGRLCEKVCGVHGKVKGILGKVFG